MIQIDTDVLKELAVTAKSAANELESATQLLNQITTHNDWGCKERVVINEAIQKIKNNMKVLRESSDGFMNAAIHIAEEFVQTERKIPEMFEGLEALIGEILNVGSPLIFGTPGFGQQSGSEQMSEILEDALSSPSHTGHNSSFWDNIFEPLTDDEMLPYLQLVGPNSVIDFSTFAEILENGRSSAGGGTGAFGGDIDIDGDGISDVCFR